MNALKTFLNDRLHERLSGRLICFADSSFCHATPLHAGIALTLTIDQKSTAY